MSELTKEWLLKTIAELEEERDAMPGVVNEDAAMALAAMKLALASLEAEPGVNHQPVAWQYKEYVYVSGLGYLWREKLDCEFPGAECETLKDVVPLYKAPPEPVAVPDAIHSQGEKSASDDYYALGWNACRAAMLKHSEPFIVTSDHRMMEMPQVEAINAVTAILQGADGTLTNEGTIPVTQFKPVADLYGLTSPTGGETSFTFDAVEARDFIDGGWLCQEYVTLERYQEAITNHTEDKLAMVDHSGDSNNMVESVTTACELRDVVDAIRNSGIAIDGEKILAERDALNSPVIPDGWVACSDRMPEQFKAILAFNEYGEVWSGAYDRYWNFYCDNLLVEHVTHWMPLPNPPKE
ncbi:DUF551 domain-containing protein [Enterobacter hormaechei]|uniref:DUF551 domain-containing protein n=2 Tax=Enterobacter hormaechei TaxID=158836 RepID=UPI003D6E45E2